jgi:hypothetical protein
MDHAEVGSSPGRKSRGQSRDKDEFGPPACESSRRVSFLSNKLRDKYELDISYEVHLSYLNE